VLLWSALERADVMPGALMSDERADAGVTPTAYA
jgi:hypothetical protein